MNNVNVDSNQVISSADATDAKLSRKHNFRTKLVAAGLALISPLIFAGCDSPEPPETPPISRNVDPSTWSPEMTADENLSYARRLAIATGDFTLENLQNAEVGYADGSYFIKDPDQKNGVWLSKTDAGATWELMFMSAPNSAASVSDENLAAYFWFPINQQIDFANDSFNFASAQKLLDDLRCAGTDFAIYSEDVNRESYIFGRRDNAIMNQKTVGDFAPREMDDAASTVFAIDYFAKSEYDIAPADLTCGFDPRSL